MSKITFQLFQAPKIFLDGELITLPFKKAEALLYYLAIHKSITREQAAALLWAGNDEQTAKKNLRHTLYTIKKVFGQEVIVSPQKQVLTLNPELTFDIDYDQLMDKEKLDVYQGEFLHGFYVKNAPEFEDWMETERTFLKDTYLRKLYEHMMQVDKENIPELEATFAEYTREDPLDERVYFLMMQAYQHNHLYHKGIKVYQSLSKLLNSELRISPSKEIASLHRELLNAWTEATSTETEEEKVLLRGRKTEIQYLSKVYNEFLTGGKPAAVMLMGEMGVGKTHLMNTFLDDLDFDSCLILRAVCFQAERDFILQPWNAIMMQIDHYITEHHLDIPKQYMINISNLFPLLGSQPTSNNIPEDITTSFNYRVTRNSILKLLFLVGEEIPIVLSIDNIQYMDQLSLELLSLVIREKNPNVMVIGTCLDMLTPTLQKYINSLNRERLITQIMVKRFTRNDVAELVKQRLGDNAISSELLDTIYRETEGNAFFLEILLNNFANQNFQNILSVKTQDILMDRISNLATGSRQVLNVISLFHDFATLDVLEYILNQDTLEILELLDDLKDHGLIEETVVNQEIHFCFRHNKMQEFVHSQLSPSKRRLLHSRVATYLEQLDELHTKSWYQSLIYHYELCGNEAKALQYHILSLEEYSALNFDLYPVMQPQMRSPLEPSKEINKLFDDLFSELYRLYHVQPNAIDYSELEARLLLISGKYNISQGLYQKGIPAINKALSSNAYVKEHPEFRIHCLRQLTFYGIQIWDTELMEKNIKKGIALAQECAPMGQPNIEYAIECRLYGLLQTMKGKYQSAQEYLLHSLELFQSIPLKTQSLSLNMAACFNYLGEVQRKEQNFELSLDYYDKAIDACISWEYPVNPTFYTNKARSLLALGRQDEAEELLKLSCKIYDDTSTLMGRAITKCYYCRILADRGEWSYSYQLLTEASKSSRQLSSPLELGLLAQAKIYLLENYPKEYKDIIHEPLDNLHDQAYSYLADLPGVYELQR